jgi:hypothetical protein
MDAVEFVRERERMCSENSSCNQCDFYKSLVEPDGMSCKTWVAEYPEKTVAFVEKWSKEHPRKTLQSVFLEQYPEARIGDDGVLQILPCSISASHRDTRGNCVNMRRDCYDCRREFWMQEME